MSPVNAGVPTIMQKEGLYEDPVLYLRTKYGYSIKSPKSVIQPALRNGSETEKEKSGFFFASVARLMMQDWSAVHVDN